MHRYFIRKLYLLTLTVVKQTKIRIVYTHVLCNDYVDEVGKDGTGVDEMESRNNFYWLLNT